MKYTHGDFLQSPQAYEEARRFWRLLWEEARSQHHSNWRTPWLNEPTAALRDGNPIFTAWSPVLRRGVRIVQRPASAGVPDLSYWLDVFGGALHEPDAVEELVLNCSPTLELEPQLRALLSSWISGAPLSVSIEAPQLMTEGRQLVMPALSQHVGEAA